MGYVEINGDTIENIHTAEFSDILNEVNRAELNFKADDFQRVQAQVGNTVKYITGDGKRYDFIIDSRATTDENLIKLICLGAEEIAVNIDIDLDKLDNTTNKTKRAGNYVNKSSSLIYADLLSHLSGWSLDLSNSVSVASFKLNDSDSVWNGISRLANLLAQEIKINYATKTYIIADNLGVSQLTILNERVDFLGVPSFTEERAKGKRVIVYGKGDGDLQIKAIAQDGSYSLGDKTIKINDPTITSDDQALAVANKELSRLKQSIEHYNIPAISLAGLDVVFNISDTVIINSPSVGVNNRELKIVRLTYLLEADTEYINIEVTNSEYSRAFKSQTQKLAEENLTARNNSTFNQGSGNTLTFGGQINGTSTAPLIVNFNLPENFIKDEAGNIRVNSMTVDYDIDPFRKSVGNATFTGSDPQVQNSSSNTLPDVLNSSGSDDPNVTGFSSSERVGGSNGSNLLVQVNTVLNETLQSPSSSFGFFKINTLSISKNYDFINTELFFNVDSGVTTNGVVYEFAYKIVINGIIYVQKEIRITISGSRGYIWKYNDIIPFPTNSTGDTIDLYIYKKQTSQTLSMNEIEFRVSGVLTEHFHGDGTFNVSNHSHTDGTYNAENHSHNDGSYDIRASDIDNISIGDSVSDAASVFATSTDLYLDFWNSTSWINKHSVLTSNVTLKTDVDITNGGVYPDVAGLWRVRLFSNSGNPDLFKGIVKLKHSLDS